MTKEQIVQKVCEIMGVNYSHYDNHDMSTNYFGYSELKSKPKIVVYSSKYGPWEFSILEDMSIISPLSLFNIDILIDIFNEKILNLGLNEEQQKQYDDLIFLKKQIKLGEEFLKQNNCALIINNPNKKVNWV